MIVIKLILHHKVVTEIKARDDGGLDQGGYNRDEESELTEIYFENIMERLNDGLDLGDEENEWMKNDSWVFILNYPQGNGTIASVG